MPGKRAISRKHLVLYEGVGWPCSCEIRRPPAPLPARVTPFPRARSMSRLDADSSPALLRDVIGGATLVSMDRRGFLARAAGACAAFAFQAEALRLVFIRPLSGAGVESAVRGIQLGVEEAARTGALMGRTIELHTLVAPVAPSLVRARAPAAIISGFALDWVPVISAYAEAWGVPFLNLDVTDDLLRGEECRSNLFHVAASDAMLASAQRGAPPGARAALWHHGLERFGAAQLNDRYRARFGTGMDDAAWAGWMAVKVVWEASLRARSTAPAAILDYLRRDGTQFDGHKGWPLSFRAWDGQLRQPLYLLSGEGDAARVVGELPERADPEARSSRAALDALGADATTSTCTRREAPG